MAHHRIGEETIFADGVTCRDLAKLRQRVGMVFQRSTCFHLTAVENVVLAQMHAARSRARSGRAPVRCFTRLAWRGEQWRIRSGCQAESNSVSRSHVL
jgi:ABC-type polar amino acid transport system ATPase subunit